MAVTQMEFFVLTESQNQGNIYISTLEGINKFDGHTFTALTAIPSKPSSDNWKLQPDDLWFNILGKNGDKGPYRYDGKNLYQLEFPKHYMADEYFARFPNKSWSPYDVYYIYKDSKGTMWFGTAEFGVCRYDGNSLSWLYEDHLTNSPNGASFGIRSILEDEEGKYWFCNTRYRFNISYDGKKSTHYPLKDNGQDITLFSIYEDKEDQIWLGTHETGVLKFNGETFEKFTP